MIELITGAPRAGKTYLTVKLILDEFFTYNKQTGQYEKKPGKEDITLITNIEGLRLEHISLTDAVKQSGMPIQKFFTKDYQEKISKKYPHIIYAIDECQQFFPDTFKDIDTRFYFEYHGHLGHHIYLITQDRFRCCRAIVSLAELETRAVKRTLSIAGEFKYNIISDKEIIDRKLIKPSKKIYALYRSQFAHEHKKPGKPFLKWILLPILLTVVAGYLLINRLTTPSAHAQKAKENNMLLTQAQINYPQPPGETVIKKQYEWYTINGTVFKDGRLILLINPITDEVLPPALFPYKLRIVSNRVQAKFPIDIITLLRPITLPDPGPLASANGQPDQPGVSRSTASP